ncbi:Uncharacterised protein [Mycobacterium tuberculosis]|nr:Uncharacterised protein [Mycobacterium tuberculosis]
MRLGRVLAVSKTSPTVESEPMATVSRMVLTNPRMRETRVPAAMIALERASLRATYVSPVWAGDCFF